MGYLVLFLLLLSAIICVASLFVAFIAFNESVRVQPGERRLKPGTCTVIAICAILAGAGSLLLLWGLVLASMGI